MIKNTVASTFADIERFTVARVDEPVNVVTKLFRHTFWKFTKLDHTKYVPNKKAPRKQGLFNLYITKA